MKVTSRIIVILSFSIILSGCSLQFGEKEEQTDTVKAKSVEVMQKDEDAMEKDKEVLYSGNILAGATTKLLDFNQADYDKALASSENIVLYFYADWCPLCKTEVANGLYPAFNQLNDPTVIGFRVNFRDSFTDANEEALAKEFGVPYQHTKVFLKNGVRVLKDPSTWDKSKYLDEINKLSI